MGGKSNEINLILFVTFAFVSISSFVVYMIYKVLGCRISCWMNGIRVHFKRKKQGHQHTTMAYEQFENSFEESLNASIRNVDNNCCCFVTNCQNFTKDEVVLPNSHIVTYGEFKPVTSHWWPSSLLCCCRATKFPRCPKNDTCPICLETFSSGKSIILLQCAHGYHNKCLVDWLRSNNKPYIKCPLCNRQMHVDRLEEEHIPLVSRSYMSPLNSQNFYVISTPSAYRNYIITHL